MKMVGHYHGFGAVVGHFHFGDVPETEPNTYPNSWVTGFNSPINMSGTIYMNQIIGETE